MLQNTKISRAIIGRYFLIFNFLILAACGEEIAESHVFITKTPNCEAAAGIQNEYLIQWNSGKVSKVTATSKKELIQKELQPYLGHIRFVEPNYKIYPEPPLEEPLETPPKRPDFIDNWGPLNIGAGDAWSQQYLGQNVIVAVLDSGVDIYHPQLIHQIAYNNLEIPNNGFDDDGNGFTDDYAGFNFVNNTNDVTLNSEHGTHIAGIIAAEHNEKTITHDHVQGVAPKAKILPVKFLDKENGGTTADVIKGINYAVERGAKVINASWGGLSCSLSLELRIEELEKQGVLFVTSSGNEGLDLDGTPRFPASWIKPSMITVGSINNDNFTSLFSNFGQYSVDIYAPGNAIYSTFPNNRIRRRSGTSMSAPFVSAAAAVLWSKKPSASVSDIKTSLLKGVLSTPENATPYINSTQGRLHLAKALQHL